MSFEDPATPDRPVLDSGVHLRDSERAPASAWQIGMAAVLIIAILCVFFYGLTNQRQQVAGNNQPHTNVAAPLGHAAETTGQGTSQGTSSAPSGPQLAPKAGAVHPKQTDDNSRPPASMPGEANQTSR
jgi:hypothetical protein